MNPQVVRQKFEYKLRNRIIKSTHLTCNIDEAKRRIDEWKAAGDKIVFTAGVFDIFTINHLLGLYHYKMLGGDRSRLIVSVDTDEHVRRAKAFKSEKGNTAKPILSWENRTLMIAKQTFGSQSDLVDLIVQHGVDTCGGVSCAHDDNVDIAQYVMPDVVVVTSTSVNTINSIESITDLRERLVIIDENDLSYSDRYLNGKVGTTAIIERVKHGL